jgi:hypothetical protein
MEKKTGRYEKNHEYGQEQLDYIQKTKSDGAKEKVRVCRETQKSEYPQYTDHPDYL